MTKNEKIKLATTLGTVVFRQTANIWFAKRCLGHLFGRTFTWKEAYCSVALAQIAGGYAETGRRLEVDAHEAIEKFKASLSE